MSKKGTKALASATLMSLVLTTALSAGPVKAAQGSVTRIGEADRYATAASVATKNWTTSDNVVLVSGEGYADAVSASALAKQLDAPILLTTAGSLNTDTANALSTLKAKNIYVVGGNASVSQAVRDQLKSSYTLIELGGANRYETNAAVAQKLVDLGVKADNVIMVGGEGFSDALSVAPVAAAKGQILLLGMNDANYMKPVLDFVANNKSKVTVVGTKNVISDAILSQVNGTRVDGGSDRWDTNLKVLAAFKDALKTDKLYVASASYNAKDDGYADALVASALAGKTASPLVLVDKENATGTNNAVKYIADNATKTTDLNVVGGTGVVSSGVVDAINKAVTNPTSDNNSVESIEAVSLNQIKVHFNASVDSDSAEDVTNYKIDGTQLTQRDANNVAVDENSAVAKAVDDNTVLITLAHPRKQYDNVTVTVKKGVVLTEDKNNSFDEFEQDVEFKDVTQPTLKSVTVEGNSQLTVEFSEAVNMGDPTSVDKAISQLKSKFKIDGQSIGNYGVNTTWSDIKDHIAVPTGISSTNSGTWANKVMFYFDSAIESGNHTLKISDGDSDGVLRDSAGFVFKEASQDFTVDSVSTKPVAKTVEETSSGEVHITFDRPMDVQTAKDLGNYEINGKKLSSISGAYIKTDNNDTLIKLKHISDGTIQTGSNTVYIKNSIKDAYGNKVADDTRVNFTDVKDETKPTVQSVTVVDSETIRVKFSKDVDYNYATNKSNYKLLDNKDLDITSHIKGIYSTVGESDTGNTDTFNIKLTKFNPSDTNDDWRLTGSKYTLTIKNIIDTASTPNTMEDFTQVISGNDNIAPKGTGIYAKLRSSSSEKDKVIVYFSEAMDSSTITNKDNYKFINGEGDTKSLPSDANISAGGDDKSAIIEFPTSYNVKTGGKQIDNNSNNVYSVIVSNVKDEAGNILDGVAFNNDNSIGLSKAGAQVKDNTVKSYYDGDDLKVDVQFDRALDDVNANDFTFGGVHPTSAPKNGDKVTLIFKDGASLTSNDSAPAGTYANGRTVTYANGKTNTAPSKIELIKAQGQNARLAITSTTTTDETGALVSVKEDGTTPVALSDTQALTYDYQAAPRTTCWDDTTADYWTATKDNTGGKVYVTFDTILDTNSGVKTDDFTFTGLNGTDIKADNVNVVGNTVVFSFNTTNKDYSAFTTSLDVRAKSSVSLRTQKDVDGNNATYTPSSDDIKKRTITITDSSNPTPVTGQVDLSTVAVDTNAVPFSTVVTFKLAGVDGSNYNVKVNGVDAIYNATTGKFAATVDGTLTADKFTQSSFVVSTKSTTTTATADLTTVAVDTNAVPFSTVVTFKLANGADGSNYTVKVKNVDAIYNATTGKFAATVDGTYTADKFTAADFVVSAK
ncbi:cell wall-binding repeat-containing protein [Clostridium sp. PL3]|uniref:Cell wall-binding repeat-containing protein n=1 Tax=Clostridium thailandense TaxID=2794346 RepID=A0A949WVN9_9CLOT|nr:cell wall-binding repeat-containing protein [Clostridium thailandense]MBV7273907.1 cell wall-binding repeat-containing protein [Clostridium thailandense]